MIELCFIPVGIPDNLDRNRPVVVVDIFRASTSIAAALHSGADAVYVAGSMKEADALKQQIGGNVVLAGERGGLRIEGYDLGNSPREMTPDAVAGRHVIFNSTNGTKLLRRFAGFQSVVVGSFVCLSALVSYLGKCGGDPILCCAGQSGKFSTEDALAAGFIISRLDRPDADLDDAGLFARRMVGMAGDAWKDWARNSSHGHLLASLGLADDLDFCLTIDKYDFVPVLDGDRIRRNGGQ
jgi:2-phosphosulfolactate phosphatase